MKRLSVIYRAWKLLFKHERYRILWGVVLSIAGLYPAITVLISREIVNSLVSPSIDVISGLPNAFFFGGIYSVIMILQGIISSYSTIEILNIRDRTRGHIDQLLMEKVAGSYDISDFETPENSDRIRLASIGGQVLPTCFSESLKVLQYIATVVGLLIILVYFHPLIAVIVFLPAIPLFYAQVKVRSHTYSAMVHFSPQYRKMGYLIELMLGAKSAKEIKVYRSGSFFLHKYKKVAEEIFNLARECRKKVVISTIVWGCVAACGIGGAYLYIIYLAMTQAISIGDVVMYSGAVFYAGSSIRGLIQTTSNLWSRILESESFFTYVDTKSNGTMATKVERPAHIDNCGEEWVLKNVCFSYPGNSDKALDNISFNIKPREKIAIVGLNGAGKTTLMKIMLGLLKPDQGTVRFRGIDLRNWDLSLLREEFGVVFQDFSRFKLTLYENIELAAKTELSFEAKKKAVFKAAKLTGVDEIAKSISKGYDTLLAKEFFNGTDLSGGQWQKVALSRAFLRDTNIILLDEPTASLDAKTEQAIFEQFLSLANDKTAIIISHRFSITPLVDRVLTLERGCLIEEGTHEQLLGTDGKYAQMYKTQARMYWSKIV